MRLVPGGSGAAERAELGSRIERKPADHGSLAQRGCRWTESPIIAETGPRARLRPSASERTAPPRGGPHPRRSRLTMSAAGEHRRLHGAAGPVRLHAEENPHEPSRPRGPV
jgi:hypothetical protein